MERFSGGQDFACVVPSPGLPLWNRAGLRIYLVTPNEHWSFSGVILLSCQEALPRILGGWSGAFGDSDDSTRKPQERYKDTEMFGRSGEGRNSE